MGPLRILVVGAGVSGIATARALLRDGHEVTIFDQRPDITAGGGAVTIWSNGATVLDQLGVDMVGAGQPLSAVRVTTASGRPLATVDLDTMVSRLGAPIRMVPRRILLERLLTGFPVGRVRCRSRAIAVSHAGDEVRVDLQDGSTVSGDVLIGADGLHSLVRETVGAPPARPTGWCSWQGLITLPRIAEPHVARMMIGAHGNLGLWPAGETQMQWWFDLPWAPGFSRPPRPIAMIRRHFAGWSDLVDEVLARLTDEDLAASPFPHFRHPVPDAGIGRVTLLGDAAHTMPPTLAQGTNQALLDAMVLRRALSESTDVVSALRRYENTRRRRVKAVSWVTTQQVSRSEAALRPVSLVPDRAVTWALTRFLGWTSHRGIAPQMVTAPMEVR
ncbi:FAD-dependent oxidoreductase [Mycobacterium paraterrae]|uniref:FAD-dependent oxidoreductase n=1 Tax=Mycobacterium paraterrae TaxID=577492 RepID=A0ABY3VLA8_9MYCO|nr:FAD-dependent oxidoreductase [Mycobacterium paraterrae]UMB70213.1 FAD-dependent oxidoreductase [Mycobacterium paraterrae]